MFMLIILEVRPYQNRNDNRLQVLSMIVFFAMILNTLGYASDNLSMTGLNVTFALAVVVTTIYENIAAVYKAKNNLRYAKKKRVLDQLNSSAERERDTKREQSIIHASKREKQHTKRRKRKLKMSSKNVEQKVKGQSKVDVNGESGSRDLKLSEDEKRKWHSRRPRTKIEDSVVNNIIKNEGSEEDNTSAISIPTILGSSIHTRGNHIRETGKRGRRKRKILARQRAPVPPDLNDASMENEFEVWGVEEKQRSGKRESGGRYEEQSDSNLVAVDQTQQYEKGSEKEDLMPETLIDFDLDEETGLFDEFQMLEDD